MSTIFERVKHLNHRLSQQEDCKPTVRVIPHAVQGTVPVTASKLGERRTYPQGLRPPLTRTVGRWVWSHRLTVLSYPKMSFTLRPGILQFWLDPYDDLGLGVDLKNPVSQVNTRVIYYPNLEETNPCAHTLVMPDQEKQNRDGIYGLASTHGSGLGNRTQL